MGRPRNTIGAHTNGYNSISVGVCFEGDFNVEKMSEKQLEASVMLISVLSLGYHNAAIRGHRNFNSAKYLSRTPIPHERIA